MAGLPECCYGTFVELRSLGLEHYKGYAQRAELELAPLTILVGANNSGKTALAQAIQLLAGGLAPEGRDTSEPLPLESGGIRHGETFADLVTGRSAHGWLHLSANLADANRELSLSATVRHVESPPRPPARQVANWRFTSGGGEIALQRSGFEHQSDYEITASGSAPLRRQVPWKGLLPDLVTQEALQSGEIVRTMVGLNIMNTLTDFEILRRWARGVRHLQCPRSLPAAPFITPENTPAVFAPDGRNTPLILAANGELRESVRNWYRDAFGVTIDVAAQGSYSELVVGAPARDANVRLTQSGRGLLRVMPVVVMALTAAAAGPGVDVIEHPEAELHPAAHAHVAELLLANLAGPVRPLVVETHSEMVLLRARRWVAEGRLPAAAVVIYWVHAEPGSGSVLRKIRIDEQGQLDHWPDGVFIEDYEEIMAIRRAARPRAAQ